jgi:hypothetical protein
VSPALPRAGSRRLLSDPPFMGAFPSGLCDGSGDAPPGGGVRGDGRSPLVILGDHLSADQTRSSLTAPKNSRE